MNGTSVVRKLIPKGTAEQKLTGAPTKKCKGWPICKETLSAKSDFDDCAACRRHYKKWSGDDVEVDHVIEYFHRAEKQVYRLNKLIPRRLATVRQRA